ncbi:ROK family transcriptional regulator [Demequina sp. NBRC 110056]|uniref:ROK family transcriptional regulator n=1 Tax=Demequina sp. NBRC 110056 TaxID=1570345 RepID=UPI0009FBD15C|nr:ROK family transcriptional regulator [Demequina sp. NBRC 110056]
MIDPRGQETLTGSAQSEVFQILRDGQPRTRSELATLTGLARSTVAARVDSLLRAGLVRPVADAASTGGRPSRQFAFDGGGLGVLGVDVGATHVHIGLSDLRGRLLTDTATSLAVSEGPDKVLGWVVDEGRRLLADHGNGEFLRGVGVGLPGPVEHTTGRPVDPPIMPGWDRFDVTGLLTDAFAVPVLVDNDVNVMALGERIDHWPDVDDLLFVKVSTGIGAGVISSGRLQRGAQGIAGDIGHVYVPGREDVQCRCGNSGCLEAVAAGPAIAAALRGEGLDVHTVQDVATAVTQGDVAAVRAVREAGRVLGQVLTACVSLVNPAVIVLGGPIASAGDHLLAGAREVIYTRSTPIATGSLQIVRSRGTDKAAVSGASSMAIQHVLSVDGVEALLREATA